MAESKQETRRGHDNDYPPDNGVLVTPSDSTVLAVTRGIVPNVDGTIAVRMSEGQQVIAFSVKAGLYYPISIDQFRLTGTVTVASLACFW
jgi:hypothetical protein